MKKIMIILEEELSKSKELAENHPVLDHRDHRNIIIKEQLEKNYLNLQSITNKIRKVIDEM